MTQGGPADATRTIVYYVYDQAFSELEISYACTLGLALFFMVMSLTLVRFVLPCDRSLISGCISPVQWHASNCAALSPHCPLRPR